MHIDVTDKSELAILKAGSEIILKEPIGNSCIKDQEETPLILVAEKIGIASIIGMVDKLKTLSNAPTCYVFIKKNTDEQNWKRYIALHYINDQTKQIIMLLTS